MGARINGALIPMKTSSPPRCLAFAFALFSATLIASAVGFCHGSDGTCHHHANPVHPATVRRSTQRKVAKANAPRLTPSPSSTTSTMLPPLRPRPKPANRLTEKKKRFDGQDAKTKDESQDTIALRKKLPRYVAVDTPKDKRSVFRAPKRSY